MKSVVPFTKDILFKSKIAEITSISLEHELDVKEDSVTGNFIISGDYKSHEVSVNKEEFLYKLPFSVELTENIDLNTFNFEILDFYYDVIDNDTLRINIEFEVKAEKKEEEKIEEREVKQEEIFTPVEEEIENIEVEIPVSNKIEEPVEIKEQIKKEKPEERVEKEEQETILNNIDVEEDDFMTYNIHIVREMESFESISEKYNVSVDLLKEYNNLESINIGDKIIIPEEKDE
ncbi:MAG TPA: LysM peptidoglycan-binding domain-containing protein [Bacilli bacterium]|nr:LysM peptidoglycan-binding domain-containing protein [Bacilli bacterium]